MFHFVTSYMKRNKSPKQTLEGAQNGLKIIFNNMFGYNCSEHVDIICLVKFI